MLLPTQDREAMLNETEMGDIRGLLEMPKLWAYNFVEIILKNNCGNYLTKYLT